MMSSGTTERSWLPIVWPRLSATLVTWFECRIRWEMQ